MRKYIRINQVNLAININTFDNINGRIFIFYVLDIVNDLSSFLLVYFCNYRHVLISVSLLQAQIKEKARKIELLEAEQDLLTKRNTYRLKVIQELGEVYSGCDYFAKKTNDLEIEGNRVFVF